MNRADGGTRTPNPLFTRHRDDQRRQAPDQEKRPSGVALRSHRAINVRYEPAAARSRRAHRLVGRDRADPIHDQGGADFVEAAARRTRRPGRRGTAWASGCPDQDGEEGAGPLAPLPAPPGARTAHLATVVTSQRPRVIPAQIEVLLGFLWVKLGGRGRRLRCPGGGSAPGAGSPQPRRCLHPAPSRSGHPLILRKRFARSIIGTHPLTGSLRAGCVRAARAGQGLPRRTRRGCGDPAPTGRDLASWIVVGAAAIHGETPPWHARLTWSLPNVGSTRARPPKG